MRTARPILIIASAVALVASTSSTGAQAAPPNWPGLTLSFNQAFSSGPPNSVWDVWIDAALAPGADPIVFDGTSPSTGWGLGPAYLPAMGNYFSGGQAPFATYENAYLSSGYL